MKTQLETSSGESYISSVEKWTDREFQLHRLHEEILAKRESLLRTSEDYFKQQSYRGSNSQLNITNNATLRNQYLIQDIEELQQDILKDNLKNPTPRFLTLEKNYMAMMNGILPLWEKDIHKSHKQEPKDPNATPNPKPRKSSIVHRSVK